MTERKFTFHNKVRIAGQNIEYGKYSKPYEVVDYTHLVDTWRYRLVSAGGKDLGWHDEKDLVMAEKHR